MNQSDYDKIFPSLPPKIQEFLNSEELTIIIRDTAILTRLNSEQTGRLSYVLGDVFLGKLSTEKSFEEIKFYLEITDPQVQIIKEIITKKIFEPLKDDLNQLKINQPKFIFQKIQQKETITPRRPFEILEEEAIKTKEIKESVQEQKSFEAVKTEVTTKEEVLPDLSLPEIQEIQIERPVNRTGELKRVIVPSTSPEAQEKIHSKLMEAMNKKEVKPKIVEEMKKVVIEGIKKTPQQKSKPKTTQETKESITSQVIGGEGEQFTPEEKAFKSSLEKPYIFDVKLKEEPSDAKAKDGKQEKERTSKEGPIQYQKYQPQKPFGEA
jgi:hypothetical protein